MGDGKRVTVVGGNGYAGGTVVREAASRGHRVTSISRSAPADPIDDVTYVEADAGDAATLDTAVADADVVVAALSPRGALEHTLLDVYRGLADRAASAGVRLVVVGGFSSLRPAPGAPRFSEGDLDPRFASEGRTMAAVVDWLQGSGLDLDWVYISPAMVYGSFAPGEATGSYRLGGDVALQGDGGPSTISGSDFALAVVDLVGGGHSGEHVSAAS